MYNCGGGQNTRHFLSDHRSIFISNQCLNPQVRVSDVVQILDTSLFGSNITVERTENLENYSQVG